jgi:hypothetical protein
MTHDIMFYIPEERCKSHDAITTLEMTESTEEEDFMLILDDTFNHSFHFTTKQSPVHLMACSILSPKERYQ